MSGSLLGFDYQRLGLLEKQVESLSAGDLHKSDEGLYVAAQQNVNLIDISYRNSVAILLLGS
jgi:hypothetical protein